MTKVSREERKDIGKRLYPTKKMLLPKKSKHKDVSISSASWKKKNKIKIDVAKKVTVDL